MSPSTEISWIGQNLRIIDKRAQLVPLVFNRHQMRLHMVMEMQAGRGLPVRIIVLKARQLGMSTGTEAIMFARAYNRPTRKAFVAIKAEIASMTVMR